MKLVTYKDDAGEWRWRLRANNGRILADSGEGYKRRHDMDKAIAAVRRAFAVNETPAEPAE